jgi:quercetin dioxygenase-like cupin family protein
MKQLIIAGMMALLVSTGLVGSSQSRPVVTALTVPDAVASQQPGIKRTELQRHDLSTRGREAVQVRIDFAAGTAFAKHRHPGEEIIYVIEGLLEYQVEGKPAVTLKAGEVLFIPVGTVHTAKNVGKGKRSGARYLHRRKGKTDCRAGKVNDRSVALPGRSQ